MSRYDVTKSTESGVDLTAPSTPEAPFRGGELRGLQAFGWFGGAVKAKSMQHRVVDHRTLHRPRRDP